MNWKKHLLRLGVGLMIYMAATFAYGCFLVGADGIVAWIQFVFYYLFGFVILNLSKKILKTDVYKGGE